MPAAMLIKALWTLALVTSVCCVDRPKEHGKSSDVHKCVCKPITHVYQGNVHCPNNTNQWLLDAALTQISKHQSELRNHEDSITQLKTTLRQKDDRINDLEKMMQRLQVEFENAFRKKDKKNKEGKKEEKLHKKKTDEKNKEEKKEEKLHKKKKVEKDKENQDKKNKKDKKDEKKKEKKDGKKTEKKNEDTNKEHKKDREKKTLSKQRKDCSQSGKCQTVEQNRYTEEKNGANAEHKNPEVVYPKDCADVQRNTLKQFVPAGVYRIQPAGAKTYFKVYCDFQTDGGGWTVFQRRINSKIDFYKNWEQYRQGFGDLTGSFWLGNDKLNMLTSQRMYELRVEVVDFQNRKAYATYSSIHVDDETKKYTLHLGKYSGNAGDSLAHHDGQAFSTYDWDNDMSRSGHCARENHGAWWYGRCYSSNLNGRYRQSAGLDGMVWHDWHRNHTPLLSTMMKIRPIGFKSL